MDERRRTVWIVGAGSGTGRAVATALAEAGWDAVLSGRRRGDLEATRDEVSASGGRALVLPYDVTRDDPRAAARAAEDFADGLDALVLAAGLNSPRRTWGDQVLDEVDAVIATNLTGAIRTATAALPAVRRRSGVVVLISSYSGWTHQPSAGVAYSASKTALGSLARTLNAQEAADGVRACHVCPGDIDTDFLRMRPLPPSDEQRARMLAPADVAQAVAWVLGRPPHVRIDELVISPVSQG